MQEDIKGVTDLVIESITTYGLDIIGAIVILVLGVVASKWGQNLTQRALSKSKQVDSMLRGFFASIVKYLILIFTGLMVLSQFGVQTASLIAVLGAAGLAVGLALQGTLSNIAAGVMILIFRPFKIGDYVEVAGHAGTIASVSLFVTEMATPDNVQIVIPNGQVWGSSVKNYSYHPTRRLDLTLGISYEDDIEKAAKAIEGTLAQDSRVLGDPAAMVAVSNLGDSSVDFTVRIWCNAGDYWPLKFDLTRALKERMDSEGISIPYPQRTIHTIQQAAAD